MNIEATETMGRGKLLTEIEKGKILAFRRRGVSERRIASKIKRSKTVVHHVVHHLEKNYYVMNSFSHINMFPLENVLKKALKK